MNIPVSFKLHQSVFAIFSLLLTMSSCTKDSEEINVQVYTSAGDINTKLTEFRSKLGTLNSTVGQTTGRREINWDGVPDNLTGIKLAPDFFNPTAAGSPEGRQRGLFYADGADAMVSKTGFSEVNPLVASELPSFSGNKLFAVVNANAWPVEFRVAGQTTRASTKGFGAVFVDVDNSYSVFIEYFNETKTLGKYYVPASSGTSRFSFLGVYFPNDVITRVVITHEGKLVQGEKDVSQGGTNDLVALDDFIYAEPVKL
ncbi:MAG: hypothetical protein NTW29_13970 [Bacteroidetes bacterium]|nr:hypothetical protein [Bacteroidota bacterium]